MGDSKSSLGFLVLVLIVLFSGTSSAPHSLSYNFTISSWPRDDQPWCEVQGEVDQKVFLSYDCGTAKIKYMSPLGEEVKNMSAWETQTHTLRDTGDLLQGQMPDVTPEKHTDKGPLTLQARMTCWCEDNGHTSAFWEFGFSGQLCLLFDSENGHCTMVHPGGRQMKEKWENDRAVTDFFKKVSMGDCWAWLQAFLVRWEKMLKTSASLTTGPSTVQPMAPASNHFTWITTGVLTSFVIMSIIIACIHYKKRKWPGSSRQGRRPTAETGGRAEVLCSWSSCSCGTACGLSVTSFLGPRASITEWPCLQQRRRCSQESPTCALSASGLSLCLSTFVLLRSV